MNPKELRIGNFFHKIIRSQEVHLPDTSTIFEITAIPSYGVEAVILGEIPAQVEHHDIIEFYNLSPIPITEEWLLGFGFDDDCEPPFSFSLDNGDWYFVSNGLEVIFSPPTEDGQQWQRLGYKIKYVHQLQNLFYALTGEELEIKQPA